MQPYSSMSFEPQSDYEVYCYLKQALEPAYQVLAHPSTAYYSEWLFHYEIRRDEHVIATLAGDFRDVPPGKLLAEAHAIVTRLKESSPC